MSHSRKGFGEQTKEKITPDSQKSTTQKASETVTGAVDKGVAAVQPEGDKSFTQSAGDSTRGTGDSAQSGGKTYLESAQETAGNLANSASETLSNAADSLKKQT